MNRESLRCCCEFISSDFTIDFKTKSEQGRGGENDRERERERSKLGQSKVAKSCKYLVDSIVQLIEN